MCACLRAKVLISFMLKLQHQIALCSYHYCKPLSVCQLPIAPPWRLFFHAISSRLQQFFACLSGHLSMQVGRMHNLHQVVKLFGSRQPMYIFSSWQQRVTLYAHKWWHLSALDLGGIISLPFCLGRWCVAPLPHVALGLISSCPLTFVATVSCEYGITPPLPSGIYTSHMPFNQVPRQLALLSFLD